MTFPRNPDLIQLQATVERLAAENAVLRDQLRAASSGVPAVRADYATLPVLEPPRRRRWMGNIIGALLLSLGFALGALFVARKAPETAADFRRGYDDGAAAGRAAKARRVAPPAQIAPPAPNATAPSTPPAP